MAAVLEQVRPMKGKQEGLWLVKNEDGRVLGFLTRFRDTRTETHPWKAFRGIGATAVYLGAFYRAEGGQAAAIAAVQA